MKIALVQPKSFQERTSDQLAAYRKSLEVLKREEIDIVVFPEFFSTGFYYDFDRFEEPEGETVQWMKDRATELNCAMVGSVPVTLEEHHRVNRLFFVSEEQSAYYDKRHVFLGPESDAFRPGSERVIVSFRGMNILLQLCYDMRFPVWSRVRKADYDLILNVAQWPESRISVPLKLCAARAIENQAYYVFCNWNAEIKGEQEGGCSHLVLPDGNSMESQRVFTGEDVDIFVYEIKENLPSFMRKRFKVSRDADDFELR